MSEIVIKLETIDPIELFGNNNSKLKILTREFGRLKIATRGNKVMVAAVSYTHLTLPTSDLV